MSTSDPRTLEVAKLRSLADALEQEVASGPASDASPVHTDTTPAALPKAISSHTEMTHDPVFAPVGSGAEPEKRSEVDHLDANGHPCDCDHGGGHVCTHS